MPVEQSKIFLDKRKLSTRYVPSNLPHRDKQLQELDNFFKDSLMDPSKDFLKAFQILDPAGSGKTSTMIHRISIRTRRINRAFDADRLPRPSRSRPACDGA